MFSPVFHNFSQNCRVCSDCGSRTPGSGLSSRWHNNYSVCDSCYQQRNKGSCCPLCGKAYRTFNQQKSNLVTCAYCKKCVHAECDPDMPADIRNMSIQGKDYGLYCCPICKDRGPDEVKRQNRQTFADDGYFITTTMARS